MTSIPAPPACPEGRYQALAADGPDAARFLQGQLTGDVLAPAEGALQLAGLLNAQGRVLALPWIAAAGERRTLLLPAALGPTMLEHLRRYQLRARLTLSLAPAGPDARRALEEALAARLGGERASDWTQGLVRAGIAEIDLATSGVWIPQMLNLDLLGGISFSKGCYTGQEIVARTHHLGRIKRRTYRYVGNGAPPAAGEALHAGTAKVGEVVVAAADGGGMELLAVVNRDAHTGPLTLADGRRCASGALPYAVD